VPTNNTVFTLAIHYCTKLFYTLSLPTSSMSTWYIQSYCVQYWTLHTMSLQ